jgi:dihydroceramidase
MVASPAFFPDYSSSLLQFVLFHLSFAALEIFLLYSTISLYFKETNAEIKRLHVLGVWLWLAGVSCWVLDYFGCEMFWQGDDSWRGKLSKMVGFELPNPQLHAWWHICASSGLYLLSVTIAEYRQRVLGFDTRIEYYMGFLPFVHRSSKTTSDRKLKKRGSQLNKDVVEVEAKVLVGSRRIQKRQATTSK